ncbi:molecular chaperone DnaJ [Gudongella sp. DL1XJH-153]|uniref:molecular chaperone DnaJ n=1 Tax=Gudongella sp. DL1XJH-153 TaxID=3409804 RepID=UPI003BB6ED4E
MVVRDFYEILDLPKDATQDDIKRAYRKLAKKYHPDLNPNDSEAEQSFKEVNAAYEILSNQDKRSRYDRYGHAGIDPQAGGGDFGGFGDIFDDLFGGFGGFGGRSSGRRSGPVRGADIQQGVTLEFKEAVFGVEKEVQLRRYETCSSCDGTGAKPGTEKTTCTKCHGSGEVRYAQQTPFGQFVQVGVCDQCDGAGEIIEEKCETCHGSGKEIKTRKINVNIPAGVDSDSVMTVRGEGHSGEKGGPPGDLYLYISVKEDPVFTRKGVNIYVTVPISFAQATLGSEIEIPTLEGTETYTIPAGTPSHSRFKLKNKGVANVRGLGKGDLIFTVEVIIPKDITDKQRELLLDYSKGMGESYKAPEKKGFFKKVKDVFQ